jgi:predicted DCC family thiol-disulfide oxidoreductase YuxK
VDKVETKLRPVLVYDGSCGFCTRSALWLARRWRVDAEALPAQRLGDAGLAELGLTPEDVERFAWWIDVDGQRHRGHLAIAEALEAIGGGWAVAGRGLSVPPVSWLARLGYRLVAKYRHRLPGGTAACRL